MFVRKYAGENVYRSAHAGKPYKPSSQISVKRTSAQTWLHELLPNGDIEHKAAAKISQRIKHATRMHNVVDVAGEPFQVANYGIGGTYSQHSDSSGEYGKPLPESNRAIETRIATTMAYLTDVKAGGATVFPNAGVTIWPKKGNLAFWYNNDLTGRSDHLTIHGGCPVLAGSKWITNKWIQSHAQMRNYPCPLRVYKQFQRIKPVDNDLCKMLPQCDNLDNLYRMNITEQYRSFMISKYATGI